MLGYLKKWFDGGTSRHATDRRHRLGFWAERVAARHLRRLGYRILERNVCMRYGELDLVAKQGETLVFCEVRARKENEGRETGKPGASVTGKADEVMVAASIDQYKQKQLVRLAAGYLQRFPDLSHLECRFDVVLLWKVDSLWRVEVIADAFRPGW